MYSKLLLTITMISGLISSANAQITLEVGGGLGFAAPVGDYGGSTINFYDGNKYGLKSGFDLHAKARIGLPGFNLFGMIEYSSVSNEGEGEPGKDKEQVKNSQSILSLKAGPEFNISLPLFPAGLYLDGFVSVNTIGGTVEFQGLTKVPSGKYDVESAARIGVGAGGGLLLDILPVVTLDIGIHYNVYNLFGKQYSAVATSHERLDAYTSLNDDKDPFYEAGDDEHIIGDSRSMSVWQLTLTAMFGL